MRWFALVLLAVLCTASPAPEPKKYKPEVKDTKTNSSLTNEEKQFLREVEAKFGIKSDAPVEDEKRHKEKEPTKLEPKGPLPKLPFPAVIAIEIVNDTDSNGKSKRTIDANLGYGYRTNQGYSYSYFGKPSEKGKFVLYPYSQEDIPPARKNVQKHVYTKGYTTASPNVEIQPSQAYELVPVKEEESNSYEYRKPSTEYNTKYEQVKGLESPPPPYTPAQLPTSTLYTTYNGNQFSGLSGQFPNVMPNYFVDSSQLLKTPQYQSAGLTSDYIRSHGAQLEQKVVPVLVLRIPSSYLKNPSAELYANLPQNYPLSQYLNNVNLQELVNQYFAKIGYSMAPQIMPYNHSPLAAPVSAPVATAQASSSSSHYEPQHYANPYVRPSYTQADYSGVQYSAVQPVMAKYPSKYSSLQYYMAPAQPIYHQQPVQNQQYEYQYQYVPSQEAYQQYFVDNVDPEYQHQIASPQSNEEHSAANQASSVQDAAAHVQYEETQAPAQHAHSSHEVPQTHYRPQHVQSQQYESEPQYELPKEDPKNDNPTKVSVSSYSTPEPQYEAPQEQQQYYSPKQPIQKETIAMYPSSPNSQTVQRYQYDPHSGHSQNYYYQKQVNDDSASKTIVISENYPSKDHTIATVLPYHKTTTKPSKPMQKVNYVTPLPFASKFQSKYNIMVPQTVLGGATSEKVSYVNSHSLPAHYLQSGAQYNPEEEYTTALHHVPARSSQKAPSHPRNYHSQPKRMVKTENKPDSTSSSSSRKRNEKNDKKKSS